MTAASTQNAPPEKSASARSRRKGKFLSVCSGIEAGSGLGEDGAPSYTLTAQGHVPGVAYVIQGFPDDWTKIEKKPGSGCPDGPRYKAVGNSMTVLVIRWIGQRILKVTSHA